VDRLIVVAGRGRHGGGCGWQGGSRGRGESLWREKEGQQQNSGAKKRTSADAGLEKGKEEDLMDTATSPQKQFARGEGASGARGAKKQLLLEDAPVEEGVLAIPPPPPQYFNPREQKKQKKCASNGKDKQTLENLAGSSEECRRAQ
jgi:hypothetical protein